MKKVLLAILFLIPALTMRGQDFERLDTLEVQSDLETVVLRLRKAVPILTDDKMPIITCDGYYNGWVFCHTHLGNISLPIRNRFVTFEDVSYTLDIKCKVKAPDTTIVKVQMYNVYINKYVWNRWKWVSPFLNHCFVLPEDPHREYKGLHAETLDAFKQYMEERFERDCGIITQYLDTVQPEEFK